MPVITKPAMASLFGFLFRPMMLSTKPATHNMLQKKLVSWS